MGERGLAFEVRPPCHTGRRNDLFHRGAACDLHGRVQGQGRHIVQAMQQAQADKLVYWLSWVPIGFGVLMGLSGLLGWTVHPDTLTRLPS
jgi:hypothetical protein